MEVMTQDYEFLGFYLKLHEDRRDYHVFCGGLKPNLP